jgi:hypothetical protein
MSSAILCRRWSTIEDVEKCNKEGIWEGLVTRIMCLVETLRTRGYTIEEMMF